MFAEIVSKMATTKVKLNISEQIERAREGRSQKYIVEKMNEAGLDINEVQFSRKKKGPDEFNDQELKILSNILGTELSLL